MKPTLFLFLVAGACFARMRAESVASSVVRESSEAGLCNYARLAEAAANAGDYRRLNDYLEKITVAVKDAPGTLPVARALELTARLFLNISRGDDAIAPLARAEDIEERLAAPDSSEILHLRDTKAISLYDRGRYAEAERLWKSVIEIFEAKHQSGSVYAVAAAFHLGEFYTAAGDYKNADHIFTKLLGTTGLARDALCRPIVQAALAKVLMQEGRIDRARAAYESALRAASASALRNTVQFGEMCFDYAELKARQKDWDMAADYVQRALRIELDAIPGNQVTAATLELAAQVYKKLNRRTEAKDFAARAKQIRSRRDTAMQASTVDVRQLGAMR